MVPHRGGGGESANHSPTTAAAAAGKAADVAAVVVRWLGSGGGVGCGAAVVSAAVRQRRCGGAGCRKAKFSICINEGRKGYFLSGRGLRQWDPMSPCLFTLEMEVFALLMAKNVQQNLSEMSGLNPKMDKSIVFFGNVKESVKEGILDILPFVVRKLPVKYLGVHLITKRLTSKESSVLSSLNVYGAAVFLIPKSVVKEIDKILKGFLWCKGEIKIGKAKVEWKTVCSPKSQGGLGLKSFGLWNEVLLIKNLWNIAAGKNTLLVKWEWATQFPSIDNLNVPTLNEMQDDKTKWADRNVYNIWKERNARIFTGEVKDKKIVLKSIVESVKLQLSCLKVKKSCNVDKVAARWNVRMYYKYLLLYDSFDIPEWLWEDLVTNSSQVPIERHMTVNSSVLHKLSGLLMSRRAGIGHQGFCYFKFGKMGNIYEKIYRSVHSSLIALSKLSIIQSCSQQSPLSQK
uniref:RNA-directed DNA polymerase, eukaryota, reverse transcriptase zinc-binding domain protein n=1 Tax=Tanacetum cinerariifolium TaxID=118510 RepID=A0A699GMI0_TANCI|nr:hypothetical protein [Tanacetum cinerariifolium]